ncbi:MAG: hypothetical protein ACYDCL_06825, partial [Myxococcales bacterium]
PGTFSGPAACCADPNWPAAGSNCGCALFGCVQSGSGCSCAIDGNLSGTINSTSCSAAPCCSIVGSPGGVGGGCTCFASGGACEPNWTTVSSCTVQTTPCLDPTQVPVASCT